MRKELAQDVAVIVISDRLGIDQYGVVGRLHAVWSWADGQIAAGDDGNARGVTKAFLDRYLSAPGFADAMVSVGWLEVTADGIRFPHFERHNTQTAKTRGLTAVRAAACKTKSNAPVTLTALPNAHLQKRREEKRREDPSPNGDGCAVVDDPWAKPKRVYQDPPKESSPDPSGVGEVRDILVGFGFNPSNAYNLAKKPTATKVRVSWLVSEAKRRLESRSIDKDKAMGFVFAGIRDGLDPDPGPLVEDAGAKIARLMQEEKDYIAKSKRGKT